jgi:hypothetical protein
MIIDNNFLNNDSIEFIEKKILSSDFPWYWFDTQVDFDNRPYLGHPLINRQTYEICSPFWTDMAIIFNSFIVKNNIKVNKVFRANLNLTFKTNDEKYIPKFHLDHDFEHKQFIMYLNNSDGDTEILINKKSVMISPEKFKAVVFENYEHRAFSPSINRRITFIVTFN